MLFLDSFCRYMRKSPKSFGVKVYAGCLGKHTHMMGRTPSFHGVRLLEKATYFMSGDTNFIKT